MIQDRERAKGRDLRFRIYDSGSASYGLQAENEKLKADST
jgi:hypothetical protein